MAQQALYNIPGISNQNLYNPVWFYQVWDCVSVYCKDIPVRFRRFHIQIISVAQQYIGSEIIDDVRLSCKTISISYEGLSKMDMQS